MKKFTLILLCFCFSVILHAQVLKTATVTVSATGVESQTITVIQESMNLIKNGNFVTDGGLPSPWTFWSANGGLSPIVTNGAAFCSPVASPNIWDYGFGQPSLTALPNIPYTFSFKAWSASNRSISVTFQDTPENNYNRYGTSTDPEAINGNSEWTINLTTVPTTYTLHVVFDKMVPTTIQNVQFMLSATSDIVYIDDVSLISTEDLKPSTNLVITECYMGNTPQNYFEFTNMGTETINLAEFEFGHLGAWEFPWTPLSNPLKYMMLPNKLLAPGKSFLISSAYDYNPENFKKNPEQWSERITKPEFFKIADLMFHVPETEPVQATDSVTPTWNVVEGWGGRETYFLRQHYINPTTGLKDSVVIDQVGGIFDEPDGTNYSQAYSVAGISGATLSHVLIRKNSVKTGNINFNAGRGLNLADSEWIPVQMLEWNRPWRAAFWTTGNQVNAVIDANTLVSKTGKVIVDLANSKITVPWGIRNDDSIMYQFVRKPGLAWKYDYAPTVKDSAYISARTGDKLTLYACGDVATIKEFTINVLAPTADDNIVIPKNGYDYTKGYYGSYIHPYSDYRVTNGILGMDTIQNVDFATRVDTLMKYLEKAPKANWKIVYKSGVAKPDLVNGDILRVTSESSKAKDYFLKVDKYVSASDAILSSITWPDMPSFFKGDVSKSYGWKGDTIPGFSTYNKNYIVNIPLGYEGIPALGYTKQSLDSRVVVKRAKTLDGTVADRTVTFTVTAENETVISVYTVRFEKTKDPANLQPFKAEPFISQVVFRSEWSSDFIELANPGTEILDLSNYMITASLGTEASAWAWNNGASEWSKAYFKYIPGKKWQDNANWQVQPRIVIPDLAINPLVYPGDVFVMAQITNCNGWLLPKNHPYMKEVDINFGTVPGEPTLSNPWGLNLNDNNVPSVWCNSSIYLYKILNDSVKNGLKPATNRNDFQLIESFGGLNTNNWKIAGFDAGSQEVGFTRKSNIYKPNAVANGSWGTNATDSEWFKSRPADFNSLNLGWPWTDIAICTGIGSQTLDEITIYKSTVSSKFYKVSPGYGKKETIKGLTIGTTVSTFYNNIIKADALQTLKVKSAATGLLIPDANTISKGDTLIVLSADSTNTSKYILDVTANGLSSNALLTSTKYTVNVTGSTGTIAGIQPRTLLKDVVADIVIPAWATLTIVDNNDAYVTLNKLNYDTTYVNVIATDQIYFEVIAENGTTKILYQLKPTSTPSDAYLTSDIYSVDQFASLIQFIPVGTSVQSLISNVYPAPGATVALYDKDGFVRLTGDIYRDDKLLVTAADGTTKKAYYLSMLSFKVNPYLAYVISDDYQINQVTHVIIGPTNLTTLNDFKSKLYPSFGASLKVLDKNGIESNNANISLGDKLMVTAADGITNSIYEINLTNVILHFVPVWTGNGTDHMNINIYSATLDGVELEAGDEIGIFDGNLCVGVGSLTGPITTTNTLNIAVSRNDGSGNGYTSGNSITYKLYDKSNDMELSNVSAIYDSGDASWSTDGMFAIGVTAFAELTGVTSVNQDIILNTGWNIISANVIPANLDMKAIFQTLIDGGTLKKVMDETGKTIENFGSFGGWKNSIGNLNSGKGYKVNITAPSTLSLEGMPVSLPMDISLNTGWNIISYPASNLQDAKEVVQALIDAGKLKKVMDETGKTVENFGSFGGWKNSIGNFTPGKGYKVSVTGSCILSIPVNGTKSAVIVTEVLASEHFKPVFIGNGTDHMNVNLVNLQASGLLENDQIGVFDGKLCVGSATIGTEQLMAGSISIAASSNDEPGKTANGFTTGHPVELQLYRGNQTFKLTLVKMGGYELFEKNESLFAQVNTNELTAIQILDESAQFMCYPNPFTKELTIEIQNSDQTEITVEIYNLAGQQIKSLFKGTNSGNLVLRWNGTNESDQKVNAGVYLCKVNGQSKQVIFEGGK